MYQEEIRVNYGKLEGIIDAVNGYLTALNNVETRMGLLLEQISGGSGSAYDCLVERSGNIQNQIDDCKLDLDELLKLLCGYNQDTQGYIQPSNKYSSMVVNPDDISQKLGSIRQLCEPLESPDAGLLSSIPWVAYNPFAEQEEKEAEEENYRIVEEVRDSIQTCYRNHIKDCLDVLDSLYQNYVLEYANKDNAYADKASDYYYNHIESKNDFNHIVGTVLNTCGSFFDGILDSLFDLVTGILELGKGTLWFVGAGIPYAVCEVGNINKPDWVKEGVEDPIDTIGKILDDPKAVLDGIGKQITDCYEEKGLAYCTGYGVGSLLGLKGIDKISKVGKVAKVAEAAEDAEGVAVGGEAASGAAKVADGILNGGAQATEAVLFKGSEKTWREFLAANPEKSIEEASASYLKLIDGQSPWPEGFDIAAHTTNLKAGDTFQMVLDEAQPVTQPGNFATFDNIPNTDYARNILAVKLDWKTDCRKVVTYRVKKGVEIPVIEGPVGPQIDLNADKYLPGKGNQIQMLFSLSENKMDYLEVVSVKSIR